MRAPSTVKRGRLTDSERAEIERLASEMKKPTPGKIALRLNRHVATVNWYMLIRGLIERPVTYVTTQPYVRDGRTIFPFDRAEDVRVVALRREGKSPREIADIVNAEFARDRTAHGIGVRLVRLAATPAEEAA